jgi:hypothetical protein
MTQTNIKAVELIRQIRNQHYELLKDQSREEIKAFFHREAAAANTEAEQLLEQERPPTEVAPNQSMQSTRKKRRAADA